MIIAEADLAIADPQWEGLCGPIRQERDEAVKIQRFCEENLARLGDDQRPRTFEEDRLDRVYFQRLVGKAQRLGVEDGELRDLQFPVTEPLWVAVNDARVIPDPEAELLNIAEFTAALDADSDDEGAESDIYEAVENATKQFPDDSGIASQLEKAQPLHKDAQPHHGTAENQHKRAESSLTRAAMVDSQDGISGSSTPRGPTHSNFNKGSSSRGNPSSTPNTHSNVNIALVDVESDRDSGAFSPVHTSGAELGGGGSPQNNDFVSEAEISDDGGANVEAASHSRSDRDSDRHKAMAEFPQGKSKDKEKGKEKASISKARRPGRWLQSKLKKAQKEPISPSVLDFALPSLGNSRGK
jgi:hypothetical protein